VEVLSSRTIIVARDFLRSRRFYEHTLGLRVYREYGVQDRVSGVVFFLGGGFLEITSGGPVMRGAGDAIKLWLQVADLAAEHERLRTAGVTIRQPPARMSWGLDECWIEDPDGLELRLIEVPPDHPLRRRV